RLVYSVEKFQKKDSDEFSFPMKYLSETKEGKLYHNQKFNTEWLDEEQYEQLKNKQCPFYIEVPNPKTEFKVI
ncbi:hypothetical protein OKZ62_004153, partial [Vibrio navarrensis]|nr:hypothetical protein [Vibrio navarrensis]